MIDALRSRPVDDGVWGRLSRWRWQRSAPGGRCVAARPARDGHGARRLEAPGAAYLLGSDNLGRDVLSRVLHGTRTALAVAVGGVAAGTVVGTAVGMVSAYRGGWLDLAVQRVVDVLLGFPLLALVVVVVVSLGVSAWSVADGHRAGVGAASRSPREVVGPSRADRRACCGGDHPGCEPAARAAVPRAAPQPGPRACLRNGICVDGAGDRGSAELPGPGRSTTDTVMGQHAAGGPRVPGSGPVAHPGAGLRARSGRPWPLLSWGTRWGNAGAPGGGDASVGTERPFDKLRVSGSGGRAAWRRGSPAFAGAGSACAGTTKGGSSSPQPSPRGRGGCGGAVALGHRGHFRMRQNSLSSGSATTAKTASGSP